MEHLETLTAEGQINRSSRYFEEIAAHPSKYLTWCSKKIQDFPNFLFVVVLQGLSAVLIHLIFLLNFFITDPLEDDSKLPVRLR